MQKIKKIFSLFLCVGIISCESAIKKEMQNEKNDFKIEDKPINNKKLIDSLINASLNQGDTLAFNRLYFYYALEQREGEILSYSITMAHKYNYTDAYFYVFYTLAHPKQGGTINTIDEKTRNLALYYLIKSYELGYIEARYTIKEIFGNKSCKSSEFLDKLK